jgi:hypothetical protein
MFTTAAVAQEETESANFLLPYCKLAPAQAGNKAFLVGRCVGLVQGIADTLSLTKEASGEKLNPLCVDRPKGTSADQTVKVVVQYGDGHPDQTHAPFTVVAALALTQAWPCRK